MEVEPKQASKHYTQYGSTKLVGSCEGGQAASWTRTLDGMP